MKIEESRRSSVEPVSSHLKIYRQLQGKTLINAGRVIGGGAGFVINHLKESAAVFIEFKFCRPIRKQFERQMNNMTVDCDCVATPEPVKLKDYGILASLDPVALDQACVDIVFNMQASEDNDNRPLIERINQQHGIHTIEWAEKIGLGTRQYDLVSIDE